MNLEYIKVSLFKTSYKKNNFNDIQIFWEAPVFIYIFKYIATFHTTLYNSRMIG